MDEEEEHVYKPNECYDNIEILKYFSIKVTCFSGYKQCHHLINSEINTMNVMSVTSVVSPSVILDKPGFNVFYIVFLREQV